MTGLKRVIHHSFFFLFHSFDGSLKKNPNVSQIRSSEAQGDQSNWRSHPNSETNPPGWANFLRSKEKQTLRRKEGGRERWACPRSASNIFLQFPHDSEPRLADLHVRGKSPSSSRHVLWCERCSPLWKIWVMGSAFPAPPDWASYG